MGNHTGAAYFYVATCSERFGIAEAPYRDALFGLSRALRASVLALEDAGCLESRLGNP